MSARRAVWAALSTGDSDNLPDAGAQVDAAKRGHGERGHVWWADGSPDLNRRVVARTPYAAWFAEFGSAECTSELAPGAALPRLLKADMGGPYAATADGERRFATGE